jgi:hypothetical protein
MYRVRRIYTKKGKAHREVRKLETGTQDEMEEAVIRQIDYLGLKRKHLRGIAYAYRMERTEDVYPSREEYFVAAPATVEDKSRYGYEWFEARWNLIAPGAPAQGALSL